MSRKTGIEWCDHTFNIAWGCMKVSPGCAHCYAETLSSRFGHDVWGPAAQTTRRTFGAKHWAEPLAWNEAARASGTRARVFCSSMCDVFEDHPIIDAERAKLWPLIRATPHLDWLLLTKRPERIHDALPADWCDDGYGYPNVWIGTSIESQEYANRVWPLVDLVARVKFLSFEPLLGPVILPTRLGESPWWGINWAIVGGESGPGARPMELDWARRLRDDCASHGVAFFLKQLGGFPDKRGHDAAVLDGARHVAWPTGKGMRAAGRS